VTQEIVMNAGQRALEITIVFILLLLVPPLLVGLLISMFQAATQINEQTLSFIPKIVLVLIVMILAGPWMLALMVDYTERLFQNIPFLIG
jgi:flagellar biosynthetic protein FliQ